MAHILPPDMPIGFGCTMREKGGKKYEEKALLCGCLLPGAFSYGLRACSTGVGGGSGGADVQALEALAGEIALAAPPVIAEYPGVDRISYDSRTGTGTV